MSRSFPGLLIAAGLLLAAGPAAARTLVVNANGYTLDSRGALVRFDRLQIGDDGRVEATYRPGDKLPRNLVLTRQVEAGGRTLIPGLIDAHADVMALGLRALEVDLSGTATLDEALAQLRDQAARDRSEPWLRGHGWPSAGWGDGQRPTAADLDRAVADRPAALWSADGQALWLNSAALTAAGIDARTQAPAGGQIERDAAGRATGLLTGKAIELAQRAMPPAGPRRAEMALAVALRILGSMGVTMVHDLGTQPDAWTLYRRFGDEGRLTVRIYAVAEGPEALARIAPLRPTPWLYRDRLILRGVRFRADGPLARREAALRAPYADDAGTSAALLWNDAQVRNLMSRALMDGFQPLLTATGDAAVRQGIDAYEELAATYGTERRWRLDGALVADAADLARAPAYGIVASLQPGVAIGARDMIAARLGEPRLAGVAALRTLTDAHARLALGTGAPMGPPDPFLALHAAVTRQDSASRPEAGWRPEQGIDVRQAFAGLTTGGAYAAFAEDRVGTLEPGKWADFVLLDRDPFAIPASDLWQVQVLTTFLAGEVVFKRGDAPADRPVSSGAIKESGDAVR